jgi:hypothetical protein
VSVCVLAGSQVECLLWRQTNRIAIVESFVISLRSGGGLASVVAMGVCVGSIAV